MAIPLQIQFPVTSTKPTPTSPSVRSKPSRVSPHLFKFCIKQPFLQTTATILKQQNQFPIPKASEDEGEEGKTISRVSTAAESEDGNEENPTQTEPEERGHGGGELREFGEEIKKAMAERREREGGDLWRGVAEEVREIEWPAFGKVLGTTGVVLGVIAGSSVVLVTVNFVLAELYDNVFAGRGFQDFLS